MLIFINLLDITCVFIVVWPTHKKLVAQKKNDFETLTDFYSYLEPQTSLFEISKMNPDRKDENMQSVENEMLQDFIFKENLYADLTFLEFFSLEDRLLKENSNLRMNYNKIPLYYDKYNKIFEK